MAGLILPAVTGGGLAVRALIHADDAVKAVNKIDNVLDAANAIENVVDAAKAAENTMGAATAGDNLADAAKALDAPCSFSAETQVVTAEGEMSIAAIEIGDYVLAWNEADGTLGYYPVTAVPVHDDLALTEVIIDGEWLETTPEHPFYTEDDGWLPAGELKTGMKVRRADGSYGLVWLAWTVYRAQEMYNLTVDTAHTFFVGLLYRTNFVLVCHFERQREIFSQCARFLPAARLEMTRIRYELQFRLFCPVENCGPRAMVGA